MTACTGSSRPASPRSTRYYVAKVERKGRTKAELDEVIEWLTGFDEAGSCAAPRRPSTTFEDFFADARPQPERRQDHRRRLRIRVEEIDDPLMQKIRYLDKLVDELAKGRTMEKVLRT